MNDTNRHGIRRLSDNEPLFLKQAKRRAKPCKNCGRDININVEGDRTFILEHNTNQPHICPNYQRRERPVQR